jgi:hypothetical protein
MRTYKKLKSRKKVTGKKGTIMEMHESKMNDFLSYYATLPKKELEYAEKEAELIAFQSQDVSLRYRLKAGEKHEHHYEKELSDIGNEITKMKSQSDMLDYLSNVQPIFVKIEEEKEVDSVVEEVEAPTEIMSTKLKDKINEGIKKYIKITQKSNRGNLVDEYVNAIYGIGEKHKHYQTPDFFVCVCGSYFVSNQKESMLVCKVCGVTKDWQDPDLPQWSDEVDFSKTYRYKKLGYFIEHLFRMQAQECTVIPDYVINNVMMKLREKRFKDNDKIDKKVIKGILKELDMTSYYDNINSIIRTISGKEAPKFPEDLEDKLICMFMRTLEPFEKYKSLIPSRNNYLSYPYVIRKLLEIIANEEVNVDVLLFRKYFGLLKSRNKTWEHERVWKKICEENNWIFIPSI